MAKPFHRLVRDWLVTFQDSGGIRNWIRVLCRPGPDHLLKAGRLVGVDQYGNKYYENNQYVFGKHRWVDYGRERYYDASMVPAEWHRWIHCMTDDPPTTLPPSRRKWHLAHVENMTGTPWEYVPYSTTRPKIQSWEPPRPRK